MADITLYREGLAHALNQRSGIEIIGTVESSREALASMPWRFECDVCGKVGHVRMKGWHEAIDISPVIETGGEAVRFQRARFHRRGSGGRFICPSCMEWEYGWVLAAFHRLRTHGLDPDGMVLPVTGGDKQTTFNWTDPKPGPGIRINPDLADEFVRLRGGIEEWPSATLRPEHVPSPTAT